MKINLLVLTHDGYRNFDGVEAYEVTEYGSLGIRDDGMDKYAFNPSYWLSVEVLEVIDGGE